MNFVDFTLVNLADPATRAAVFDQEALEQLVNAAYVGDTMGVQGPYQPVFDEFQLGISTPQLGSMEGTWRAPGSLDHIEAQFHVAGVGGAPSARVDAFWRGGITARFALGGEPITNAKTNWPKLGDIDAAIAAAHGGQLPADPVVLEQERRQRLIEVAGATLSDADAFGSATLDEILAGVGAGSVGEILENPGSVELGTVQVTFAPPAAVSETPKLLPLAAAIVVREAANFSLVQLLADSKEIRDRVVSHGLEQANGNGLRPRHPVIVVWIVPETIFDDADWPGGAGQGLTAEQRRDLRRAAAGKWLAAEGIGLVTNPAH